MQYTINRDSLGERADLPGFIDGLIAACHAAWGDDITVVVADEASTTEDLGLFPEPQTVFDRFCTDYDNVE